MSSYDPAVRTRTLARIVGPYLVIAAAAIFVRQAALPDFLTGFMQDGPLVFVTGAFTLIAALAILGAHHHWSSLSACLISLIGVIAALKGASLMIAPDLGAQMTETVTRTPSVLLGALGVDLLLGVWLTFAGWLAPSPAALSPSS